MNSTSVITHIAAALAAFGLGWLLANANGPDTPSGPSSSITNEAAAAELESILGVEDPRDRANRLTTLFDQTDPSAALALHEILAQKGSQLFIDEMAEILFARWWAESDPESAFLNPINPPWIERHPWMRTVLREWAQQDPIAAARAVQTLQAGPLKGRLEGARVVVDAWLTLETMPDPSSLMGAIKQLEPLARGGALEHLVDSMVKARGIDATLDFVRGVPPDDALGGSVQQELLARTAVALIDHDIDRATDWAREQQGRPHGAGVQKHLAYYWGLRDGLAAIEWAVALPDAPQKSSVIKRAWLSFSRRQPDQAREWLTSRPPDPLMRGTYGPFIRNLAETEPESAMSLADSTIDVELRDWLRATAGEGWMKSDPTAATAWLQQSGLPPELAARVRSARRAAGA